MEVLWFIFAFMALGGSVGMVAGRNPVASLLSLVLTLFSLARSSCSWRRTSSRLSR